MSRQIASKPRLSSQTATPTHSDKQPDTDWQWQPDWYLYNDGTIKAAPILLLKVAVEISSFLWSLNTAFNRTPILTNVPRFVSALGFQCFVQTPTSVSFPSLILHFPPPACSLFEPLCFFSSPFPFSPFLLLFLPIPRDWSSCPWTLIYNRCCYSLNCSLRSLNYRTLHLSDIYACYRRYFTLCSGFSLISHSRLCSGCDTIQLDLWSPGGGGQRCLRHFSPSF